jgi:hypothetical protein
VLFQTIRPQYVADLGRHEAGHCAAILHLLGTKNIHRASLGQVERTQSANDKDNLTILAAGIRGAQHFGGWHQAPVRPDGTDDISRAVAIWSKMPRAAAEWREALDRAAAIVRERAAFVDELGYQVERGEALSGDTVDQIWLSFYPAAEPKLAQRGYSNRNFFDEEIIYEDCVAVGTVRRHSLDGGFVAFARGGINLHVIADTKEGAATALRRRLAAEKIRFRVDGKMGAFV